MSEDTLREMYSGIVWKKIYERTRTNWVLERVRTDVLDAGSIATDRRPFLLQLNCLNVYRLLDSDGCRLQMFSRTLWSLTHNCRGPLDTGGKSDKKDRSQTHGHFGASPAERSLDSPWTCGVLTISRKPVQIKAYIV